MKQLPGKADTSVFSAARLARLPGTINAKPGREKKPAFVITTNIEPLDYDIAKISRLPTVEAGDAVSSQAFARWPKPDTKAVLSGCKFLEHMLENPNEIAENQWYAGLSILGNLEQGDILAQEYSKGHKSYNFHETQNKLKQAMDASGPRTCKNIDTLWDGCSTCPHNKKLSSPVQIKGANFIKTQSTGFYNIKLDANGEPKIGTPNYTDLRKFFETQYTYFTNKKSTGMYIYNGKHWAPEPIPFFNAFAEEHFDPKPLNKMCAEFVGALQRNNLKDSDWMLTSTEKKLNFQNGILDIATNEFLAHSPEFGFQYVLPYNYDPKATAPRFKQFMSEISCGRPEIEETLLEFAGYAISGDICWAQKALMLIGEGANGKSVFLNTLRALVGKNNSSSVSLSNMMKDTSVYQMVGALFNVTEETNPEELNNRWGTFRNLVTGGEVEVKYLYQQPYTVFNHAKLLFSCNNWLASNDDSNALHRRLLIVPFDAKFGVGGDNRLEEKLLQELPGILNIILSSFKTLLARGHFYPHKYLDDMQRKFIEANDVRAIGEWLQDRLSITPSAQLNCAGTPLKTLYEDYREFARDAGEMSPANMKLFRNRLSKMVEGYDDRIGDRVMTDKHGRSTLIKGVVVGDKYKASH